MMHLLIVLLAVSLSSFYPAVSLTNETTSSFISYQRNIMIHRYRRTCSKYSWLSDYINEHYYGKKASLGKKSEKFAIFVFVQQQRGVLGGLGDRLSGLVSTLLWSIRANRTFQIEDSSGILNEYFSPIPSSILFPNESFISDELKRWLPTKTHVATQNHYCVNPRSRAFDCALENELMNLDSVVVKIRLNRCYLCRWVMNGRIPKDWKISNLIEVAGCALQSILWPTDALWRDIEKLYQPLFMNSVSSSNSFKFHQAGVHFRCGDQTYGRAPWQGAQYSQCVEKPGEEWNGTAPIEEWSATSPSDMGYCIKEQYEQLLPKRKKEVLYVASDSSNASAQIASTSSWPSQDVLISPSGCHIDMDRSSNCLRDTLKYWFGLTLSKTMILQGYSHTDVTYLRSVSSFSRWALWYGLRHAKVVFPMRNKTCTISQYDHSSDQFLGRITEASWICSTGTLY